MYNQHFGLTETPFSISPDPRYLFMSERHREALAHLLYGLQIDGGFVLLTGEVGTGKTTICRCLLEKVPAHCDIAFIFNPKLTALELLRTLCDELHIAVPGNVPSLKELIDRLNAHLLASNARGRKTVLIVDEAQNLANDVLELLRLLTNLETNQRKLLQIILLGQPELRERLGETPMRQLAQRIVARYHLDPLSRREVGAYVQHRLAVAGARFCLFPPKVLDRLYRLSGGTPRLINVICDRALLGTYVKGQATVDARTLNKAAREVLGPPANGRLTRVAALLLAVAVLAALAGAYRLQPPAPITTARVAEAAEQALPNRPTALAVPHELADGTARAPVTTFDTAEDPVPPPVEADNPPQPLASEPAPQPAPPPASPPPAARAENTAITIAGPDQQEHWLHEAMAVRALFEQWQIEVRQPTALDNACQRAAQVSLYCLHSRADLADLRTLNSPAIVELKQPDGPDFLATLLALESDRAKLTVAGAVREVPLDSLLRQWNGHYTLLWRAPPGWKQRLAPGARGAAVAWLDQRLARWEGAPAGAGTSERFGTELAQRVRNFQRAYGLQADGVAGPMTMARLAALTDTDAPALAQQGH